MHTYGQVSPEALALIEAIVDATEGLFVPRRQAARSSKPLPSSEDLEVVLVPLLKEQGFVHHLPLKHPRTGEGFEYDFWRAEGGIAMEVMGYRADDEVYKDLLKLHVHSQTQVGVFWVPRWKWVSGRRGDVNYRATLKAAAFAEDYIDVDGLMVLPYDWDAVEDEPTTWRLRHVQPEGD